MNAGWLGRVCLLQRIAQIREQSFFQPFILFEIFCKRQCESFENIPLGFYLPALVQTPDENIKHRPIQIGHKHLRATGAVKRMNAMISTLGRFYKLINISVNDNSIRPRNRHSALWGVAENLVMDAIANDHHMIRNLSLTADSSAKTASANLHTIFPSPCLIRPHSPLST